MAPFAGVVCVSEKKLIFLAAEAHCWLSFPGALSLPMGVCEVLAAGVGSEELGVGLDELPEHLHA